MINFPTFSEIRNKAKRERTTIVCQVIRANDEIQTVQFGPRGGWMVITFNQKEEQPKITDR